MTTIEIKNAMKTAGVQGDLTGRRNSTQWQVEFEDELEMWNFRFKVAQVGGFRTGHGTWILAPCYSFGDLKDRARDFRKDFITSLPGGRA